MSVESDVSRNDYVGNGSTADYDYLFKIFSQDDLSVIVRDSDGVETVLVLDTDYSVSDVGEDAGGSISLIDAGQSWIDGSGFLDSGFSLSIRRTPEVIQQTDIKNQGDFYPEVYEAALDKLCFIDQKQQDEIDRSFKLAPSLDPADYELEIAGVPEAYQVPRINVSADGMEWVDPETLAFDSASPSTTKGDLIVHDGSTNVRKGVGANKTLLVADSSEPTGVAYSAIGGTSTPATGKVLHYDAASKTGGTWAYPSSGGGGALEWVEAASAPIASLQSNFLCYEFPDATDQYLYAAVRVPSGYVAGQQIKLRMLAFCGGSSNTFLIQSLATLIRTGVDAISSTTNQRTSTNTAVTMSAGTVNEPQALVLDLSDSSGAINSVAVSAGDLILVRLTRDYANDTATDTVYVPVYAAEVTFNG